MGVLRLESENGLKKTATADKTGLIELPIRQFLTKSDSATAFLRIFFRILLTDKARSRLGGQYAATLFEDNFLGFHVNPLDEMRMGVLFLLTHVALLFWARPHGSRFQ